MAQESDPTEEPSPTPTPTPSPTATSMPEPIPPWCENLPKGKECTFNTPHPNKKIENVLTMIEGTESDVAAARRSLSETPQDYLEIVIQTREGRTSEIVTWLKERGYAHIVVDNFHITMFLKIADLEPLAEQDAVWRIRRVPKQRLPTNP